MSEIAKTFSYFQIGQGQMSLCQAFDSDKCFYTFQYTQTGNDVTEVKVLPQKSKNTY